MRDYRDSNGYIDQRKEHDMHLVDLDNLFTYHTPTLQQIGRYSDLRSKAKELAALVITTTPQSREQSLALTAIQQAVMWANAAIAINE